MKKHLNYIIPKKIHKVIGDALSTIEATQKNHSKHRMFVLQTDYATHNEGAEWAFLLVAGFLKLKYLLAECIRSTGIYVKSLQNWSANI